LGSVIRALWGPPWTRLPFPREYKYCQNGGMAFAREYGGGSGSKNAMMAPSCCPQEKAVLQGKGLQGFAIRALWGSDGLVCLQH
jgi:hypothetical protein